MIRRPLGSVEFRSSDVGATPTAKNTTTQVLNDIINNNINICNSNNNTTQEEALPRTNDASILRGPDLKPTKRALDSKLYRQIALPNGLRCVLIQDTIAMMQQQAHGMGIDVFDSDDDDDDDDAGDDNEELQEGKLDSCYRRRPHRNRRKGGEHPIQKEFDVKQEDEQPAEDSARGDADAEYKDDEDDSDMGGLRDAAAAIVVGVGSMYDPMDCQGMAHFLEHLLFMGSGKYPAENEYDSFVTRHGGSTNAYTEWEYTAYSLDIPRPYLWPALDRLAQFFIAPLLLESAVDRELLAIESEFQLRKNDDDVRWEQLLCSTLYESDHPMARFAWGNLRSLRDIPALLGNVDPMLEMRRFYHRYYYAANMRLVVIGAYSLDDMERKVADMFSRVPALPRDYVELESIKTITGRSTLTSHQWPLPVDPAKLVSWDDDIYQSPFANTPLPQPSPDSKGLQKIFRIVPVKERHVLNVTWPMPSQCAHWRSKPADFLAHLLGHEGDGSLLNSFKARSWAVACLAGMSEEHHTSFHSLFHLNFHLSQAGLAHWREMVETIYRYLAMLRHVSSQQSYPGYLYQELHIMNHVGYHYGDEPSTDEIVDGLAQDMAPHWGLPAERLLDGTSLFFSFDGDAVDDLLHQYMTPENARIDLISSSFGTPSDYADQVAVDLTTTETINHNFAVHDPSLDFDPSTATPEVEPMFGTYYWCHRLEPEWLEHLSRILHEPNEVFVSDLHLPRQNPFLPTHFALKAFPPEDADHPLLNASIKICVTVGKTKQWFPATVIQYNLKANKVLVSYEDEDEKWHALDHDVEELPTEVLCQANFEGTMDQKKLKYRIVSLSEPGKSGAVRKFGDESDWTAAEGKGFPPIPPLLPKSRLPTSISDNNLLKMWWLQSREFYRPTAELRLQIICGCANATPLHRACADLVDLLCIDSLTETSFLAGVCELGSAMEVTDTGFNMRFHGFDDKLLDLFQAFFGQLLSFRYSSAQLPDTVQPGRFEACLEVLQRRYRNWGMSASSLASSLRLQALRPTLWSPDRKLVCVQDLTVQIFAQTVHEIMEHIAVEALLHGNVDRSEAIRARDYITAMLMQTDPVFANEGKSSSSNKKKGCIDSVGLPRKKYPVQSVHRIPSVLHPTVIAVPSKDPNEPNTAVELYLQIGKDDMRQRVLIDLIVRLMEEEAFDQLRTKEQIGYEVGCEPKWTYGVMGLAFHIVTNVISATAVVERIDRFLLEFREQLTKLQEIDFLEHVVGLAQQKLDMFNSLAEETDCYWEQIVDGRFEWQGWRDEAIHLRSIHKQDVLAVYDAWLLPGQRRAIMAVHVIGAGEAASAYGRPQVNDDETESYRMAQVESFHESCKKQIWGRINSKLS